MAAQHSASLSERQIKMKYCSKVMLYSSSDSHDISDFGLSKNIYILETAKIIELIAHLTPIKQQSISITALNYSNCRWDGYKILTAEHSKYFRPFESANSSPTLACTTLLSSRSVLFATNTPINTQV